MVWVKNTYNYIEMKRYYTLLLIALLASCIQEPVVESDMLTPNLVNEPESEEPSLSSDSVLVSLKTNLDFNSEPMTKASTLNDLYGIRVYQIGNDASARCIAYGTFDDMDKVVIKLAKASKYGIDVTYIPNGKNLVHRYSDGHYGVPFDVVWADYKGSLNEVVYTKIGENDGSIWNFSYGVVQEKGITDYKIQSNEWSSVVRYQGIAICNPAEETTVEINLYAQMIGFRVSISDFMEGTVTLGGSYGHKYKVKPDNNNSALIDVVVCMESFPTSLEDHYDYTQGNIEGDLVTYTMNKERLQSIIITYTDPSGNETNLYYNSTYRVKRNTRYIMYFSLSDAIRNGTITTSAIDEGEMVEKNFDF